MRVGIAQSKWSMPELDAADEVVDLADAEQVARLVGRHPVEDLRRPAGDLVHLRFRLPERAADRDAVDLARADDLGRLAAQVVVDAALDDAEDELPGRAVLGVPVQAAAQPAVRRSVERAV